MTYLAPTSEVSPDFDKAPTSAADTAFPLAFVTFANAQYVGNSTGGEHCVMTCANVCEPM